MDKWNIPQFNFKALPKSQIRDAWKRYRKNFEYVQLANREANRVRLKHIFLALAGPEVQVVYESIPGADVEPAAGIDPFQTALTKLDEFFAAKYHDAFERNVFWTLKRESDEQLEKFLFRVMEIAKSCNFGATTQESREIGIIDKMILFSPPELKEKLLAEERLTLESLTKIVQSYGSLKYQVSQFSAAGLHTRDVPRPETSQEVNKIQSRTPVGECYRCGRTGHYGYDANCPAKNQTCNKCGKKGHFAKRCKTPTSTRQFKRKAEFSNEGRSSKRVIILNFQTLNLIPNLLNLGLGQDHQPC